MSDENWIRLSAEIKHFSVLKRFLYLISNKYKNTILKELNLQENTTNQWNIEAVFRTGCLRISGWQRTESNRRVPVGEYCFHVSSISDVFQLEPARARNSQYKQNVMNAILVLIRKPVWKIYSQYNFHSIIHYV
jgi:hypothetical protein